MVKMFLYSGKITIKKSRLLLPMLLNVFVQVEMNYSISKLVRIVSKKFSKEEKIHLKKTYFLLRKCQLPYNVACLDITPFDSHSERSNFCVVGLWTQISVWICRLPTLEILHKEALTTGTEQSWMIVD